MRLLKRQIHLLPSKLANLKDGIRSILSSMLMRYDQQLQGVVLSYDKLELLDQNADIFLERTTFTFYQIRFRVLVYKPQVGSYVIGTVNTISEGDHIGLLVHDLFNAVVIGSKGLPDGWSLDKANQRWVHEGTNEVIQVGSKLRLKVTRLDQSHGIISMHCNMLDDASGVQS
eukprot:UN01577